MFQVHPAILVEGALDDLLKKVFRAEVVENRCRRIIWPSSAKASPRALELHRSRLGLTQAEAATLCEVSLRVWSDWEGNKGGDPLYPTMRGVLDILKFAKVKK